MRHGDAVAFAMVGFGASWTLADTVVTNLPFFMQCLPVGLYLPDQVGFAATITQTATLCIWILYTSLCGVPSYRGYIGLVWACLGVSVSGSIFVALCWRATLEMGGRHLAIAVLLGDMMGALVGTLSWAATIPFISTTYPEHLISAFYTGSTSGSLVAGLLGLVQGSVPAFGPTAVMSVLTILLLGSLAAWIFILRHVRPRGGMGRQTSGARLTNSVQPSSSSTSSTSAVQHAHDPLEHPRTGDVGLPDAMSAESASKRTAPVLGAPAAREMSTAASAGGASSASGSVLAWRPRLRARPAAASVELSGIPDPEASDCTPSEAALPVADRHALAARAITAPEKSSSAGTASTGPAAETPRDGKYASRPSAPAGMAGGPAEHGTELPNRRGSAARDGFQRRPR